MREIEKLDLLTPQLADIVLARGITKAPAKIDLGMFGFEAERLAELSNADECREYASVVTKEDSGILSFCRRSMRGTAESVTVDYGDDARIIIHTHPVNTPFSSADLNILFRPSLASVNEPTITKAALLITLDTKLLAINTKATPKGLFATLHYGHNPIWGKLAAEERRIKSYTDKRDSGTISNLRMYVLTRLAHSYRFLIYSCPNELNVVSLAG